MNIKKLIGISILSIGLIGIGMAASLNNPQKVYFSFKKNPLRSGESSGINPSLNNPASYKVSCTLKTSVDNDPIYLRINFLNDLQSLKLDGQLGTYKHEIIVKQRGIHLLTFNLESWPTTPVPSTYRLTLYNFSNDSIITSRCIAIAN